MISSNSKKQVAIIGYSGHSYVVIDILRNAGRDVTAYSDAVEKEGNPYGLTYLGKEEHAFGILREMDYFIAIGQNNIRKKVYQALFPELGEPINAIHPSAVIASSAILGTGVMVAALVAINPFVTIGKGVICNTTSSIDHECTIGDFAHIGPGAVLCGNVRVGAGSFIGAAAVVKQGIVIGENVTVGAGAVVIKDISDNTTVAGNPHRILNR